MRDLHVVEADFQSSASAPELPCDPGNRRTRSEEEGLGGTAGDADSHASSSSLGATKRHLLPESSFLQTQSFDDSSNATKKKNRSFKRQRRVYEEDQEPKRDSSLHRAPKIVGVELKSQCSSDTKVPSSSADPETQAAAVQVRSTRTSPQARGVPLQEPVSVPKESREKRLSQKTPRKTGAPSVELQSGGGENTDAAKRRSNLQRAEKRSAERRSGTVDRKRRSRHKAEAFGDDDEEEDQAYDAKKFVRKKKKTTTKKVLKLHSLTADLLLQAKRLEQALVSKQRLVKCDSVYGGASDSMGGVKGVADPQKVGLRGHSSLRVVGEAPPRHATRHLPKVPGQTRTWSSIETISSPSEMPAGRPGAGADPQQTRQDSQPDLLELNAEISRMAKELRLQMMDLWTYTESTSPESMSSDTEESQRLKTMSPMGSNSETQLHLFMEAQEVFNSIASLGRSRDTPTISTPRSPSPVDIQFQPPAPIKMTKSCSSDPFICHSYPRGDSSPSVELTQTYFKLPHSYSFPSSPTLRASPKQEKRQQYPDRLQENVPENLPQAFSADKQYFRDNGTRLYSAEVDLPTVLSFNTTSPNGQSLQKESPSKVTFYVDPDAGPLFPSSAGSASDESSHSAILKVSSVKEAGKKLLTDGAPPPLCQAPPIQSSCQDDELFSQEENNSLAEDICRDRCDDMPVSPLTEDTASPLASRRTSKNHCERVKSRHKGDGSGQLHKNDSNIENYYENPTNRKRLPSGESNASTDKKHHRQCTDHLNDFHVRGSEVDDSWRLDDDVVNGSHQPYSCLSDSSGRSKSKSSNFNHHVKNENGDLNCRSRNDLHDYTHHPVYQNEDVNRQSSSDLIGVAQPPSLNLPDLEQLLPKGPETTFADLVRVHDELYRIEQEKQRTEVASTKKNVLGKRSPTQPQKHKDHLRAAYENSQLRLQAGVDEGRPRPRGTQDVHLHTKTLHSSTNEARRPCAFYPETSFPRHGLPDIQNSNSVQEKQKLNSTDQWSLQNNLPSLPTPLDARQNATEVRVPPSDLEYLQEPSGSGLKNFEHEKVHVPTLRSVVHRKLSREERNLVHVSQYGDDSSMEGKSPFSTWRSTTSSKSFDQALSTSFEWEFQLVNNSQDRPQDTSPHLSSTTKSPTADNLNSNRSRFSSSQVIESDLSFGSLTRTSDRTQLSTAVSEGRTLNKSEAELEGSSHQAVQGAFETEVTHEHIHAPHGRLRARRVSDSQVEYHESDDRELKRKVSVRLASNVFVPTKRTIFTPASKDQATPNFLQSVTDEPVLPSRPFNREARRPQPTLCPRENIYFTDRDAHKNDLSKSNDVKSSHAVKSNSPRPQLKAQTSRSASSEVPSVTVESKRKVLEAANRSGGETSPTVKGMIELYNRRITERQSLLTSPSKYWISDSFSSSSARDNRPSCTSSAESTLRSMHSKTHVETFDFSETSSPDLRQGMLQNPSRFQARGSPAVSSGGNSTLETSLEVSADETDSSSKARAFKLKQAKEEFFSRRTNNSQKDCDTRTRSSSDSKFCESLSAIPITMPSSNLVSKATDTRDKPKKEYLKTRNDKQAKESTESKKTGAVQKSASTQNVDQRLPLPIRQSSTEPALYSKSPKRILKLFKRSKDKHKKGMGAVEQLCRLSMEVDIEKLPDRSHLRSSSLSAAAVGSTGQRSVPSGSANTDSDDQSRNTLPRSSIGSQGSPSARSCPSSPVTPVSITSDYIAADHNTTDYITADYISADYITADHNTADYITADHNTADYITADHNTADYITADYITADL
ncbi:hypothetical protein FHG87_007550 [Trinorchestia longiramus]|nr:hypothetical protein FHG87_007550 [Trinorchestia longiramus]